MNNNLKQILTSISLVAIAVVSFVLFAPLLVFLIIFMMIFSFFIRRKIIRENPDFFKQYKTKKGRIIDQEADFSDQPRNDKLK